jgi:hypothetical protein
MKKNVLCLAVLTVFGMSLASCGETSIPKTEVVEKVLDAYADGKVKMPTTNGVKYALKASMAVEAYSSTDVKLESLSASANLNAMFGKTGTAYNAYLKGTGAFSQTSYDTAVLSASQTSEAPSTSGLTANIEMEASDKLYATYGYSQTTAGGKVDITSLAFANYTLAQIFTEAGVTIPDSGSVIDVGISSDEVSSIKSSLETSTPDTSEFSYTAVMSGSNYVITVTPTQAFINQFIASIVARYSTISTITINAVEAVLTSDAVCNVALTLNSDFLPISLTTTADLKASKINFYNNSYSLDSKLSVVTTKTLSGYLTGLNFSASQTIEYGNFTITTLSDAVKADITNNGHRYDKRHCKCIKA